MEMLLLSRLYDAGRKLLDGKITLREMFTDNPWDVIEEIREAECILIGNQKFDARLFDEASSLRVLAKQGSGTDNIDLEAAKTHGVTIVTSPGANAQTVAEHVIMLILAASRNLHMYDKATRAGRFSIRSSCQESGLMGKRVGLVGYGRIGKAVASYTKAFGMYVSVYDPFITEEIKDVAVTDSLETLCASSDVISIHIPLIDSTRGLFSRELISKMKEGSILVNCSRGGIVDESALYEALSSGHLHAAGIDVYGKEPTDRDNPLFTLDNIIVTPHSAALTKETADQMSAMTAEGIIKALCLTT